MRTEHPCRRRPVTSIRRLLLLAGLLLLGGLGAVAGGAPTTANAMEPAPIALPPQIRDWLPSDWWTPVQGVSGRVDDDPYEDMVVLVERQTDAPEDPAYPRGSRGLLVLFGEPEGGWRRGPLLPDLLPCVDCVASLGGKIGSAVFDLAIGDDGVVEVGWVERGRLTKAVRLSIGWDQARRALGLYADDIRALRPSGGRTHVRRDYRAGLMWVDGVPQDMPARFIPIEDVSAAQY